MVSKVPCRGAGIDGVTIQKLMGHASQNQTTRYDTIGDQTTRARQVVKVLHVPYKKRMRGLEY